VTGSAISNSRIRADDGRNVTIDVWDYRTVSQNLKFFELKNPNLYD
jgi:hypothetical protein